VAFGLAAVTAVVIARWLGPEGKGTYSTLQMLAAFIGAVTSGAGSSITYLLTRQREPIAEILPALGTVLAAVTVLAWLGLIGWSLAFGATVPLAVLAAVIPAVVVLSWRQSFFVGMGRLRDLNRQIVLVAVATFVATTGAVIVLHGNVGGALAAWALCQYVAATVVVAEGLRTGRGQPRASLRHNVDRIVRYGSQAGLNSLLGLLAYRIDSLVLLTLLGTATLGVYSVAVTMCEQLLWISRPVTLSVVRDIGSHDLAASGAVAVKGDAPVLDGGRPRGARDVRGRPDAHRAALWRAVQGGDRGASHPTAGNRRLFDGGDFRLLLHVPAGPSLDRDRHQPGDDRGPDGRVLRPHPAARGRGRRPGLQRDLRAGSQPEHLALLPRPPG
jgi:hypothetical protein